MTWLLLTLAVLDGALFFFLMYWVIHYLNRGGRR